jgi:allantoate deiminase/N-carbamoyl-L-amino-acid hydrolase
MSTTLAYLNTCSPQEFVTLLHGIYEHSPWIPERTAMQRPFLTLVALKIAMCATVRAATRDEQLGLIRAHPELAGKAKIALTAESTDEQAKAGLHNCSDYEFTALQKYNADYTAKFGFPFILAVKGPDGNGLSRHSIINTFARRLKNQATEEFAENLRQIHRIAELRLNALLDYTPHFGNTVMAQCDILRTWSDDAEALTCTFMTEAHRKTAEQLAIWMRDAGMQVRIDAIGNVIGRYASDQENAKILLTGSHYDTVRNGGKYDGREGILLPIAVIKHLHARGEKLPYHLDVIAFSEEEGVRFKSTFLGSKAIAGRFDVSVLDKLDADGISMRDALSAAGHDIAKITSSAYKPSDVLGYVEIHIEQGPVLLQHDLPVGVVSSIAGSCRYGLVLTGVASHAGTTPMTMRKDAAAAAAEILLLVEQRCTASPSLAGTVGQLNVPNGSVNVIPGTCHLSLDIRAADDATRDVAVNDIVQGIETICARRGIEFQLALIMKAAAAPCAPWLMNQLAAATRRAGVPPYELPSGAGHDAMAVAEVTDIAMLFTRCGNGGISHNPLEVMTADDADISAQIFLDFLRGFSPQ